MLQWIKIFHNSTYLAQGPSKVGYESYEKGHHGWDICDDKDYDG